MSEIERLKQQLKESRRREEEAQRREEDAQRQKEEAQRREEDAQRQKEEAQRREEDAQRRREDAEERAKTSQPQTLGQYLETCHSLNLAIQVVTDQSSTTQGNTTDPTDRLFPRRIIPWKDFAAEQEDIWDQLLIDSSFYSQPVFPSPHQLKYVMDFIRPISSEIELRNFERETVENAVQKLVDEAYRNLSVRSSLSLQGTVTFESHTNLGKTNNALSESIEQMLISGDDAGPVKPVPKSQAPKARRRAKGKGNLADQFCIYRTSDGRKIPTLAIEYKAPHKLSLNTIVAGLESEIQPKRDVINKDGEDFLFASKSLAAAVITQLFSYMVGKGIQYGYVCTGEAFIFLHIPEDPTIVYYYVCAPNLDVLDDDETRLHRTAVALVFAFILQAFRMDPPPSSWYDQAANLETWPVEYHDILKKIPVTVRKERRASLYKSQRWLGFQRSPIRTRSQCQSAGHIERPNDDDDQETGDPSSPTPNRSGRPNKKAGTVSKITGSGGKRGQRSKGGRQQRLATPAKIKDRPFCTQQCLLGVAHGGSLDKNCPNIDSHGQGHIDRLEFLRLIRAQLAVDRGPDADAVPLYLSGSLGSLFKVRLSSHGYTLVAKGVEGLDLARLQHENELYDRLQAIQGKHVPVCLGRVDLVLPYYYDSGVYVHFLFLSWAGRPLVECAHQMDKADVVDAVTTAFTELHRLRVLHCDAELRNILYDAHSGNLMVVDFERAEFRGRQPLGAISSNAPHGRRKRKRSPKRGNDVFARELQSVVACVAR